MQFTRSGKFSRTSSTTNTTTNQTLSTYGFYGSSVIYTATDSDKTLTGGTENEAFIYDLTLSGTNALRFSGFTAFNAGAGNDILDFTVRTANIGHEYATTATIAGGLGDDVIWTAGSHLTTVWGEQMSMTGSSSSQTLAGNDTIDLSAASVATTAYGDSQLMGYVTGGNDVITGSAYGDSLYGDAGNMGNFVSSRPIGGDDTIHGKDGNDTISGDSVNMGTANSSISVGGADTLYGDAGQDTIYGDAQNFAASNNATTSSSITAGNDALYGGADNDTLIGDGANAYKGLTLVCGDDRLDGGTGDDKLYGDISGSINSGASVTGGNDTFVFEPSSGADTIFDFGQVAGSGTGDDLIDVSAYGYTSFSGLTLTGNGTASVVVDFGSGNSVTVQNKANTALTLSASDFTFAA